MFCLPNRMYSLPIWPTVIQIHRQGTENERFRVGISKQVYLLLRQIILKEILSPPCIGILAFLAIKNCL